MIVSEVDSYFTSRHGHVTSSHLGRSMVSGSLSLLKGHFELRLPQKAFLWNQHAVISAFSEPARRLNSILFKLSTWVFRKRIMIRGLCFRAGRFPKHISVPTLFCLIVTKTWEVGGRICPYFRWQKAGPTNATIPCNLCPVCTSHSRSLLLTPTWPLRNDLSCSLPSISSLKQGIPVPKMLNLWWFCSFIIHQQNSLGRFFTETQNTLIYVLIFNLEISLSLFIWRETETVWVGEGQQERIPTEPPRHPSKQI